MTSIIWFRDDLRLTDHAALLDASLDPGGVIALYVFDEQSDETRPLGGAARWWLHRSLQALQLSLSRHGVPLVLRRGAAEQVLPEVVRQTGASRVVWNRRYGPERYIDARVKSKLRAGGVDAQSFQGGLLFEPWAIATAQGSAYRVYSAFWRTCLQMPGPVRPLASPEVLSPAEIVARGDEVDAWGLVDQRWSDGFDRQWRPGEMSALSQLDMFLETRATSYPAARDMPDRSVTSGLSPYLRWGELSPRTVWWRAVDSGVDVGAFLSELGWREFAWHTLYHHGALEAQALDRRYEHFPWRSEPEAREQFTAWSKGQTGIPLVDAGMRELWRSGVMHNRVRMVAASFLTKNLLIDWREGESWFWDTLVDADRASNPFNWQWVAGCGFDAAPYFRVFNPNLQQQKFDPDGRYVDRWAPDSLLIPPLVDLAQTRLRALSAYETIRGAPQI